MSSPRRQQAGEGHFASPEDVPREALTMTVPALMRSNCLIACVPERRKARAVAPGHRRRADGRPVRARSFSRIPGRSYIWIAIRPPYSAANPEFPKNTMKIPRLRWIIAILLFLSTTINYVDRLTLSVVSPDLRREFAMTEQDYSHVLTLFLVAYAIMYAGSGLRRRPVGHQARLRVVCGRLVGGRHAAWHGAGQVVAGDCSGSSWDWASRVTSRAPAKPWPSGFRLPSARWAPESSTPAPPWVPALAPPLVAYLALRYSWRAAFVVTGAMGLIWLIALAVYLRLAAPQQTPAPARVRKHERRTASARRAAAAAARSPGGKSCACRSVTRSCWRAS